MNKAEAQAWRDRWKLVNELEIQELRTADGTQKLRQLSALMASVDTLGWREDLEAGVDEVRQRWNRLREAYGV